ncbi:MAG: serine hydrolase [Pacificimonas sp.]
MRRLITFGVASVVSVWVASATSAQTDDPAYIRALAAGYEAAFTCSATFNANQSQAEIDVNELTRVYGELRDDVGDLTAQIDRDAKRVSVDYADNMPPRIAQWRPHLGCAQLPVGAEVDAASDLPSLEISSPAIATSWPMGDENATSLSNDPLLNEIVADAFDGETFGEESKTSAVVVVKNGRIIAERYAHGIDAQTPQRTWSVAKSIAGTVVGIAAQQQLIDLRGPAPIPEWQSPLDPRKAITTEHLLRMASGLRSDFSGSRTDALYVGGASVSDTSPGQSILHQPGTHYRYANNDTLLALYGLRQAMADDARYLAFPYTELFWKLGMMRTFAETDWRGDFVMSSQVWTTARDLARLGLLHLNDGVWQGERLLPRGFVEWASEAGPAQPDRPFGYGATFWLAKDESGPLEGAFAAFGNRGQYLMILPARDMLVIRRGYDPIGEPVGRFDIDAFTRAVVDATGG